MHLFRSRWQCLLWEPASRRVQSRVNCWALCLCIFFILPISFERIPHTVNPRFLTKPLYSKLFVPTLALLSYIISACNEVNFLSQWLCHNEGLLYVEEMTSSIDSCLPVTYFRSKSALAQNKRGKRQQRSAVQKKEVSQMLLHSSTWASAVPKWTTQQSTATHLGFRIIENLAGLTFASFLTNWVCCMSVCLSFFRHFNNNGFAHNPH